MEVFYLGIRHHGPGSARSVQAFLSEQQPDMVLVEGPPEAETLLELATVSEMQPPVALLTYVQDNPQQAVFHPFADFSPEWQAILYSQQHGVAFRFIDLPMVNKLALEPKDESSGYETQTEGVAANPIAYLAQLAGFSDAEIWWESTFERYSNDAENFRAIQEAVTALREAFPHTSKTDELREAYMRMCIRKAKKEGYEKIAVVCGAWHVPALTEMPAQKLDQQLLKGLVKVKVNSTWIPWTYSRLTFESGYGAGINSPGWYNHLWHTPSNITESWLSKVAREFRKAGLDISVSHVIEGVRLSNMLASMRNLPQAGLAELNEAIVAIFCFGDEQLLDIVQRELIVSHRIGQVPTDAPAVPLQHDLQKLQKKLRLPATDEDKVYTLDLRKPNDLERSKLLHRLQLLDIQWGREEYVSTKGTFKEQWRVQWQPEMMVHLIEMGVWGNTVAHAASAYLSDHMSRAGSLSDLSESLRKAVPADLPDAIRQLMKQISEVAALSGDVPELMKSVGPLAQLSRYGNVRQSDLSLLAEIVESMISRICIGLPNASSSLDDDAAEDLYHHIGTVHESIQLLQFKEQEKDWQKTLNYLVDGSQVNPLIAGKACRLLHDTQYYHEDELSRKFSLALSPAQEARFSAAWLEGFLKGSGTILLLDEVLWQVVDTWLNELEGDIFIEVLPLLRRNFSSFTTSERRKLGEKAKQQDSEHSIQNGQHTDEIDPERAEQAMLTVAQLLGLNIKEY
ncbi:DUF5682 family protein [Porifericola rhodea]|uniref:DUF5682 family protein n=1 Tax=Porifericola rhodea TaxID=930972 RepID=UPI002665FA5B|nr:DUF5682 family protein [Porifericola rhodea]WKN29641.1 DUF5682 family protein [Porifericola rhodea]